jgi:flagellar P-ring protein precursor FlgI
VPTTARIASGAIVEREVEFELDQLERIRIALRNPDFTTAERIATAINRRFATAIARATDPATVALSVPPSYRGRTAALLTDIEQLAVEPDQPARVLVDEQSGIIVMGDDVRISRVAVAQGNLTVRVTEEPQVSQPNPLAEGDTVVVPRTRVEVEEGGGNVVVLDDGVSLQALVAGLNALGVGPRDLISILQAIKAAGALQAEIVVM